MLVVGILKTPIFMQIHITREDTKFGPYTLEEANHYLDVGHLLPSDLAWHEGSPSWVPLLSVPGIKPRATPPPPPPPRAAAMLSAHPGSAARPPIKKATLILIALFLGGLGGHKFYTGNWGWGIVYLLLCWTLLTVPVALVELIRYITLDDSTLQRKYQEAAGKPFGFLW